MTKFEWERQLKRGISSLPKSEQQRVLDYYTELFADKIELDMDEQEIIEEFGNPFDVANRLIVDFYNEGNPNSQSSDEYIFSDSKSTSLNDFDTVKKSNKRAEPKSQPRQKTVYHYNSPTAECTKSQKSAGRAYGVLFSLALLTFFSLGALGHWHPGWTVFLGALVLASLIDAVKRKNPLVFNYPVFVTMLFLLLGFTAHWWHPTWILFVTIPLYYTILGGKNKKADNADEDFDDEKPVFKKAEQKPQKDFVALEPKPKAKVSAATIVTAVLLSIVFVYIAIAAWSVVVAFLFGGIGILIGGLAAIAVGIGQLVYGAATALVILGVGLLLFGLGLIFTIGCGSLFKGVYLMCKAMFGSIKKMVKGGAAQ